MDSDSYIVYIKTEDIYTDIVNDFETRFNASNYKLDRLFVRYWHYYPKKKIRK